MRYCLLCNAEFAMDRRICPKGHVLQTRPPDDAMIGRVIGERYRIGSRIGAGGFGTVYLAAQSRLNDRPCVIKVARAEYAEDPEFTHRFGREIGALLALRGPNTVQIIDHGKMPDGIDFLVMEYIDGPTLRDVIRFGGPLEAARAARIALGVCRSLEEAHALGILHRDLKPGNIMVVDPGHSEIVKVIDFGLTRTLAGNTASFRTRTGEAPATPAYASYEQLTGQNHLVDERTDVYGLGAVLYEMLTGIIPYGDTVDQQAFDSAPLYFMALCRAKEEREPTPPGQLVGPYKIPHALEELVLRMLRPDRNDRPAGAHAVRIELERILGLAPAVDVGSTQEHQETALGLGLTATAPVGGPPEEFVSASPTAPKLRRPLVAVGAAAALLLVPLLVFFWVRPSSDQTADRPLTPAPIAVEAPAHIVDRPAVAPNQVAPTPGAPPAVSTSLVASPPAQSRPPEASQPQAASLGQAAPAPAAVPPNGNEMPASVVPTVRLTDNGVVKALQTDLMRLDPRPLLDALATALSKARLEAPVVRQGTRSKSEAKAGDKLDASALRKSERKTEAKVATTLQAEEVPAGPKVSAKSGGCRMDGTCLSQQCSTKEFTAALHEHQDEINGCYQRRLSFEPTLSGKVTIQWVTDLDGHVKGTRLLENSSNDDVLSDCIEKIIFKTTFPWPTEPAFCTHKWSFTCTR